MINQYKIPTYLIPDYDTLNLDYDIVHPDYDTPRLAVAQSIGLWLG